MKKVVFGIILLIFVIGALFSYYTKVSCWNLFNPFMDTKFSNEGLKRAVEFDPDEYIQYLPQLEGKDFFESIEELSICRRTEVRKYIYIYLTRSRKYTIKAIKRSLLYIDIIEEQVKENPDMPEDIALLPMLESGFNPYAVSRSKAVGLWQFISSTSKVYGLKNNRWVDERRDIKKSTRAAIMHLKALYDIFNSWELALAAYNGGGAYLKRVIKKTGINDFWKLRKTGVLNFETAEYVPQYAALLLIYKNKHFFDLDKEIESFERVNTENIVLEYPVNIRNISKITGIPLSTIRELNPQLKHHVIPPHYRKYSLRIPAKIIRKLKKEKSESLRI